MTEVRVLGWDVKEKQVITASANGDNKAVTMGGKQSAATHAETIFGKGD